jgi:predicted RNase H-like nuclease
VQHKFIGIDLAWAVDHRHTGVAVGEGDSEGLEITQLSRDVCSLDALVAYLESVVAANTVIAIDASLIVENGSGQRRCEKELGQAFGRFGASCHSTNQGRPHWDTGGRLVRKLNAWGFRHGLPLGARMGRGSRWLIEVYPHPAMIRLFGLAKIIRYKKGPIVERRKGLNLLRRQLEHLTFRGCGLMPSECIHELLATDLSMLRGRALKCYEDSLDAVLCAYLAWHCWRWGEGGNEVFGDLEGGYVVVPRTSKAPSER